MRMMTGRPGTIALVLATAALVGTGAASAQIPDKFLCFSVNKARVSTPQPLTTHAHYSLRRRSAAH